MTHHLTREGHRAVHLAHAAKDGMHSSRQITAYVPLHDITGPEHEMTMRTHNMPPYRARLADVELTIEICLQCGFIEHVSCQHGLSYWTHRPGCSRFGTDGAPELPEGLVVPFDEAFPAKAGAAIREDCRGCLLLCPICRADGT